MIRAAAVLAWVSGLGFGLPGIYGIWYLASRGSVASFIGFPTYGGGVFEKNGIKTSVPLLVAFVASCAAECLAGWMLWSGVRSGAVLALVLFPLGLVFWIGFSLPFGPILGVPRTVLILLSWASFNNTSG